MGLCLTDNFNLNLFKNASIVAAVRRISSALASKMYYPQELLPRPRARPPLYGNYTHETGLLMPPEQRRFESHRCCKKNKFLPLMIPYLKEYCACSSVHGFRYLTDPKMRHFERIVWLLILLATFICATIVYVDLTALYNSLRVHTTIENTMEPIFFVPFPSVGLCPRSRINMQKLENEAPEYFLGRNASAAKKELFKSFFTVAADVHFNDLRSLKGLFENETVAGTMRELDHLDISKVLEFVSIPCRDIFVECNWRSKPYNCCELFEMQHTELGICWVFNSVISDKMKERQKVDKYYPLRTPQSGPGTGLEVFLRRNKSIARTGKRGVHVMVKQPNQWSDSARLVPYESNNRISMMPRYTGYDVRTRAVSARVRRCIFPDETHDPLYKNLPGFTYWRGNCRTRCHQEYVVNLCKCSPGLLFPIIKEDNFTDCKASDFMCLYEHRATFSMERLPLEQEYVDAVYKDTMTCDCLNSCAQLVFDTIHSSTPMDYSERDTEAESMHLDIFYQSPWFVKFQTQMRFTFVELLANFGGIIGLFLGASLLSAIELVYYFTIGLYLYLFKSKRQTEVQLQGQRPSPSPPIPLHFRRKITPKKISY